MATPFDQQMMGIALRLAKRGLGTAAPNPAVGAVIADERSGEVIARGWTQPGGRPHAETDAIARGGAGARGATIYVTLEPCSHHGKTPPCAEAIIAAGLKRAVVGIEDPDPRVGGRGVQMLRDAGVTVDTGVLAKEASWVTRGHVLRITERRPFVQLKLALSAAGGVPRGDAGQPSWVTGAEARAHGALLRAEADAILVGAATIADDDPELTCRLPGLADRSPVRIVLSGKGRLAENAKVVVTARDVPTWLILGVGGQAATQVALTAAGVDVISAQGSGGRLELSAVLAALAERGITRLLVEGGPAVWREFSDSGLVDEVVVFQAGGEGADPERAAASFINLRGFMRTAHLNLANDVMVVLRAHDVVAGLDLAYPAIQGWIGLASQLKPWMAASRAVMTYVGGTPRPAQLLKWSTVFTGLISDVGEVVELDEGRMAIRCHYKADTIALGASIACDGCCLTVTRVAGTAQGSVFSVDVSNETLAKTTLGRWQRGHARKPGASFARRR